MPAWSIVQYGTLPKITPRCCLAAVVVVATIVGAP